MSAILTFPLPEEANPVPASANAAPVRHHDIAKRDIGGIGIAVFGQEAALAELDDALTEQRHVKLAFCNAHIVNLAANDRALQGMLSNFLVLADGIGVDVASRLLHGASFPANLNGTDFIPSFLTSQPRRLHVALLGGKPGVAERAAERFAKDYPRHRFTVLGHGYVLAEEEAAMLARLGKDPADLLLVAMGNPLQERFIAEKLGPRHCTVAAGVGALFDFVAGDVTRAPEQMRELRLEWAYRLWLEPRRLWRRYVVGNPIFLLRLLRIRLFQRKLAE
jgi:exopolysaccharide biosynthesis WecB/TagA/CpsF family protein